MSSEDLIIGDLLDTNAGTARHSDAVISERASHACADIDPTALIAAKQWLAHFRVSGVRTYGQGASETPPLDPESYLGDGAWGVVCVVRGCDAGSRPRLWAVKTPRVGREGQFHRELAIGILMHQVISSNSSYRADLRQWPVVVYESALVVAGADAPDGLQWQSCLPMPFRVVLAQRSGIMSDGATPAHAFSFPDANNQRCASSDTACGLPRGELCVISAPSEKHPHLLSGGSESAYGVCGIMQLAHGSLADLLKDRGNGETWCRSLSTNTRTHLAIAVLESALSGLAIYTKAVAIWNQKHPVDAVIPWAYHGDICPRNILLHCEPCCTTTNGRDGVPRIDPAKLTQAMPDHLWPKLADFSLTRGVPDLRPDRSSSATAPLHTSVYRPDATIGTRDGALKADCYATGMCALAVLIGCHPEEDALESVRKDKSETIRRAIMDMDDVVNLYKTIEVASHRDRLDRVIDTIAACMSVSYEPPPNLLSELLIQAQTSRQGVAPSPASNPHLGVGALSAQDRRRSTETSVPPERATTAYLESSNTEHDRTRATVVTARIKPARSATSASGEAAAALLAKSLRKARTDVSVLIGPDAHKRLLVLAVHILPCAAVGAWGPHGPRSALAFGAATVGIMALLALCWPWLTVLPLLAWTALFAVLGLSGDLYAHASSPDIAWAFQQKVSWLVVSVMSATLLACSGIICLHSLSGIAHLRRIFIVLGREVLIAGILICLAYLALHFPTVRDRLAFAGVATPVVGCGVIFLAVLLRYHIRWAYSLPQRLRIRPSRLTIAITGCAASLTLVMLSSIPRLPTWSLSACVIISLVVLVVVIVRTHQKARLSLADDHADQRSSLVSWGTSFIIGVLGVTLCALYLYWRHDDLSARALHVVAARPPYDPISHGDLAKLKEHVTELQSALEQEQRHVEGIQQQRVLLADILLLDPLTSPGVRASVAQRVNAFIADGAYADLLPPVKRAWEAQMVYSTVALPWASSRGMDAAGLWADCVIDDAHVRMRYIHAGTFVRGSLTGNDDEKPASLVSVPRPFWMSDTEVTNASWRAIMGSLPVDSDDDGAIPVSCVTWFDCQRFCKALRARCPGFPVRLPTELEWEYACRAGGSGDVASPLDGIAWYAGTITGRPHAVRSLTPNVWGLYDMHGNLWEWCSDAYAADAYAVVRSPEANPLGHDPDRVVRGGSWESNAWQCRSSQRGHARPDVIDNAIGLRIVADVPSP